MPALGMQALPRPCCAPRRRGAAPRRAAAPQRYPKTPRPKGFAKAPPAPPAAPPPAPAAVSPILRNAPPPPPETTPSSEALPQVVSDRILGRIVTFSGVPLLLGFASGPLAYYAKISGHGETLLAPAMYAGGTGIFALAAAGISYGVLSASWDPRKKGSALGVDEFKTNLPIILDRFFKKTPGQGR
jgi:hypothetical protein